VGGWRGGHPRGRSQALAERGGRASLWDGKGHTSALVIR
jgi:hypothetical protein